MKSKKFLFVVILTSLGFVDIANAKPLSIYEIQYTTEPDGTSPENGNIIDCLGGIVTYKRPGSRPRIVLQDLNYHEGWGAIQVKGWSGNAFDSINVGDWISLNNVMVEDYRGTTFLQYKSENNAYFIVISSNNPLPKPLMVSIDEIHGPVEGIDAFVVNNHEAEKYESMLIKVINVYVQGAGYGKAFDNYLLTSNANPSLICWASDYMNNDLNGGLIYHPYVEIGQSFCEVSGILEQYTNESDGIYYDYYQLLTTDTLSFSFEYVADLDEDGDVDFDDFCIFSKYWMLYEGR